MLIHSVVVNFACINGLTFYSYTVGLSCVYGAHMQAPMCAAALLCDLRRHLEVSHSEVKLRLSALPIDALHAEPSHGSVNCFIIEQL